MRLGHSHPSQGGDLGEADSHLYMLTIPLDSTGDRPIEVWDGRRETLVWVSVLGVLPGWPSQPREADEDIRIPLIYFWNLVPV